MKKRNWTLLCLIFGAVCFGAFGIYHLQAKDNGTFLLEDLSGDRSHLSDFPLEGYGGDQTNSVEFTILNGELDVTHHAYDRETLENVRRGREVGQSEWMSYFSYAWDNNGSYADTEAVPAADAKLEYSPTPGIQLFEEYTENYRVGETITADKVDIYGVARRIADTEDRIVRYDTGLSLKEPTVFTYSATQKNGGTSAYMNSYDYGYIGEAYEIRKLESYSAEVGETLFAVTVPDERCEGETFIYRLTTEKADAPRAYKDIPLKEYITEVKLKGSAEPFLPMPDPAERRIVGLEGVGEYLAVFLLEDADFIAEIYDMGGRLIGSGRKTLTDARDRNTESRKVLEYLRANAIETYFVPYEEGCSLHIAVRDRVIMEEREDMNGYEYDNNVYEAYTGKLLLWITPEGTEQVDITGRATVTAVRGDKVLLLDSAQAPEKEKLDEVVGIHTQETYKITILDAKTEEVLYAGRLKNDFWQDDLEQLAKVDNAGGNAYIKNNDAGWSQYGRNIMELEPVGGRSGSIW